MEERTMKASDLCGGQGPLQLPKRPDPVPQPATQTARQRIDGTIEPEGNNPIRPEEIVEPRRWWRSVPNEALDEAVDPLLTIVPPCPSMAREAARFLRLRWADVLPDENGADVWWRYEWRR